jgi:hypothetical protein
MLVRLRRCLIKVGNKQARRTMSAYWCWLTCVAELPVATEAELERRRPVSLSAGRSPVAHAGDPDAQPWDEGFDLDDRDCDEGASQ